MQGFILSPHATSIMSTILPPGDIDSGVGIVDASNVQRVIELAVAQISPN